MHKISLYWQRAFENCMLQLFVFPNTTDSVFSEDCAQREKKLCSGYKKTIKGVTVVLITLLV